MMFKPPLNLKALSYDQLNLELAKANIQRAQHNDAPTGGFVSPHIRAQILTNCENKIKAINEELESRIAPASVNTTFSMT